MGKYELNLFTKFDAYFLYRFFSFISKFVEESTSVGMLEMQIKFLNIYLTIHNAVAYFLFWCLTYYAFTVSPWSTMYILKSLLS